MQTAAARRSRSSPYDDTVRTRAELHRLGWSDNAVRAQLAANRWQAVGHAIVMHNGPATRPELCTAAVINHGPRSALTSFTATEQFGLDGWERDEIHVVVPAGARVLRTPGVVTHWTGSWLQLDRHPARASITLRSALVVAAGSFTRPRPGCGILAAGVQQRLVRAQDLRAALDRAPRIRHRAQLSLAIDDIAQGAQALSEIDFRRLCARHGLPLPVHQAVRRRADGRRRYLDAEWLCPSGRRLIVEVDGAIHLGVARWVADQLRQNELVVGGNPVLRYPSVVVRTEETVVADQLRRCLAVW